MWIVANRKGINQTKSKSIGITNIKDYYSKGERSRKLAKE